jgi:hypothetical protein
MSKQHKISTVFDILKLTEDEFRRFLPDLAAWYVYCNEAAGLGAEVKGFTWVDDGRPAEIHSVSVTIKETGEKQTWPGTAFSEG